MKRLILSLTAIVVVVVIVATLMAGNWLLRTNAGARWAVQQLPPLIGFKLSVTTVEGRLSDRLRLKGVRLQHGHTRVAIDDLTLHWQLLAAITGTVTVDTLILAGVRVQDETPPSGKPVDLQWPRPSALARMVAVQIRKLQLTDLSYRQLQQPPVHVDRLTAAIVWQNARLSISSLAIAANAGKVHGQLEADLGPPSLTADLELAPAKPLAEMDAFSIAVRPEPAEAPEQLAGKVTVIGRIRGKSRLEVKGVAGIARQALNIHSFSLVRPGSRGRISGTGTVNLATLEPVIELSLQATDLDLARELQLPTDLSGTLRITGNSTRYRGNFSFANRGKGWQSATVAARFQGDAGGLSLAPLDGSVLGGTIRGDLRLGWLRGITAKGRFQGKNINPSGLAKGWSGKVNFTAAGELSLPKEGQLQAAVDGVLLESRLHGQPLTGGVKAVYAKNNLIISRFDLHGRGFDLHGAGDLSRRLEVAATVTDLSRLIPDTAGELHLAGWGRWNKGRASGAVTGTGRNLRGFGVAITDLAVQASMPQGEDQQMSLGLALQRLSYAQMVTDSLRLKLQGTPGNHDLQLQLAASEAQIDLALKGGYRSGSWGGMISTLTGRDRMGPWHLLQPARLEVNPAEAELGRVILKGPGAERIEAEGAFNSKLKKGTLSLQWAQLNLARVNPWLQGMQIAGATDGTVAGTMTSAGSLSFSANARLTGTVTREGRVITVERAQAEADGGQTGVKARLEFKAAEGVELSGRLVSSAPARPALPEQGDLEVSWQVADLNALQPWLKGNVTISGGLAGQAKGKFLPDQRLEMDGDVTLTQGKLHWQKPEGETSVELKAVTAQWSWHDESLRGSVGLTLARFGQARGNFVLPVPARFPFAPESAGAIAAQLSGQVQEQGVLSAFMPGLVQESHGQVEVNLAANGTWAEPRLSGTFQLSGAGAYLPSAGIRLRDVTLSANLDQQQVAFTVLARSGSGYAKGEGLARLKGWQVESYRGTISGDKFQVIHLPELQASASPLLAFNGTRERLAVRGEVRLPELRVLGQPVRAMVEPSEDVILEGEDPAKKAPPLALDAQVRVILGDRVLVKAAGLDAQMGGSMDLTFASLENISSKGEIRVIKGRYKAYGLDLAIVRGRVFYAGGPVNEPLLDILALRRIEEVRAGVTVSGTPRTPVIKLYSEPAMPDMDILAYMVLGHPLGGSSEQAGLVAQAAGVLLSTGQSAVLQDQIKNRLGLSTIEIESGRQDAAAKMGYKPIPVSPTGMGPARETDTESQAVLTLGKYLTPQLYISYGRSIFTGSNLFRLRYDISRRLQIETETGTESGIDLYYKMNFN